MEKRVILALVISFVVLGSYSMVLKYFYPNYGTYQKKNTPAEAQSVSAAKENTPAASAAGSVKEPVFLPENDQWFKNENLNLLFNNETGGIREISFPKFVDSDTNKPLQIFSQTSGHFPVTSFKINSGGKIASEPMRFETSVSENEVVQSSQAVDGIKITKTFTFDRTKYFSNLTVNFQNVSETPVTFSYKMAVGPSFPPRHSIDEQYIEANFYSSIDGKTELRHVKETKLGKIVTSHGAVQWAATKDRHFSVIVQPKTQGVSFTGAVEGLGDHKFGASVDSEKIALAPGASVSNDFVLYFGPNELEQLEPAGLDTIVNFGKLDIIGRMLVGALEMLHKVFKNYGVAIIVLTILINILLFPLTRVSYMSMKRMQLIQPQMTKLRDQHKKNPEKLNKEMMELYKKHKVNPFGGCLPMILQMPVFIALYVALSKSVILINSKLFWIKDLSSPDRLGLPFSLPVLGNEIHVLPLIMCAGMFFQQKFTQIKMEGQDPAVESQQKMMAIMMPIMFGFIFYSMPSGLVLYWLTNTILMTSYQLYLKNMKLA